MTGVLKIYDVFQGRIHVGCEIGESKVHAIGKAMKRERAAGRVVSYHANWTAREVVAFEEENDNGYEA